ncbi:YdbC family protein [Sporosarcina sp. YIM B06819]|uniref:YdbC family protein n=1 Tax=Sporosarcina sp. YIM B06819 TaxID=3081769 RepID=UPI00298D014A|nr:PC4/YdbC family ssDNA-binding protein [Sporosarcina sp. YIM B06819]
MAEIKFDIIKTISVLSEGNKGWKKELNLISWNDRDPVYDIRDWSEDHKKMGKGSTYTLSELQVLKDSLLKLGELE